ncbi:MAG: S8 family serine peptidase [Actinomycetota bacterium]
MRRLIGSMLGGLVLLVGAAPFAWAAPNDPGWYQQWNLSKIRADKAWPSSKGAGVVVAIVDTGVDLSHPDLQGRLVPGINIVDGGSAQDDNGHGTFMAGIVAAATGNGQGVASVAPSAKIMPVKVLKADGVGEPEDVADGIRWAVDHGAHIINLSLAETSSGGIQLPIDFFSNSDLDDAIKDAANAGRFVAVAAGNDFSAAGGKSKTSYDAQVAGVLVVGGSTSGDKRAAYSNYGQGLDVLAPGGGSASNAASGACQPNNPVVSTWWSKSNGSQYGAGCGTSMAVAHVSGLAALLRAKGYSSTAASSRILSTSRDLGSTGWDSATGHGRVDAAAAVGTAPAPPPAPKPVPNKSVPPKKVTAAATPTPAATRPGAVVSPTPAPSSTGLLLAAAFPSGDQPEPRKTLVLIATAMAMLVGVAHPFVRVSTRPR